MRVFTTLMLVIFFGLWVLVSEAAQANRLDLGGADDSSVRECIESSGREKDFAETRYVDDTPMPTIRPAEEEQGYLVFQRYWMDHVYPNTVPAAEEVTEELRVFAARGEYEPVSFSLKALRDLRDVRMTVSELVSESGARLSDVEVGVVRCLPRMWNSSRPMYPEGPIGIMNMPTYIEPLRPVDARTGRTIQYWLTIHVAEDAPEGVYKGAVTIACEGSSDRTVVLEVNVLPIRLLDPEAHMGFYDLHPGEYQGEIGSMALIYEVMARHGMDSVKAINGGLLTIDPQVPGKRDFSKHLSIDEQGSLHITWEGSRLETCMEAAKAAGFKTLSFDPLFHHWLWLEVEKRVDSETLKRQSRENLKELTDRYRNTPEYELMKREYTNAFAHYGDAFYSEQSTKYSLEIVRAILEEVERRGWPRVIMVGHDESFSHHSRDRLTWPFTVRQLQLYKEAGATALLNHISPFWCTYKLRVGHGHYVRALLPYLDIAMPGLYFPPNRYGGTWAEVRHAWQTLGKTVYTYNFGQGKIPDWTLNRYASGWFFETQGKGIEGLYIYVFYRRSGDPYNQMDGGRRWEGEQCWTFPAMPEKGRMGGVSICLVAAREGRDDLRYLRTLLEMVQEAKDSGSIEAALAAARGEALVEEILGSFDFSGIIREGYEQPAGYWDEVVTLSRGQGIAPRGQLRVRNGWQMEDYDRARWRIAQAILELKRVLQKGVSASAR